jgi:hypothetical protein
MAHQYSVTIRDAQNEAIETVIGTGAKLYLFSGTKPATCADADPSGLLATLTLPTDWIGTSAAGVKAKGAIVWTGTGAAPGVAASFRFKDSGAAACHIQGTVVTEQLGGAWMRAALWARAIRARNVREEEELAVI